MRVFAELMSGFLVLLGILILISAAGLDDAPRFWVNVLGGMVAIIGLDWRISQVIKKSRND